MTWLLLLALVGEINKMRVVEKSATFHYDLKTFNYVIVYAFRHAEYQTMCYVDGKIVSLTASDSASEAHEDGEVFLNNAFGGYYK